MLFVFQRFILSPYEDCEPVSAVVIGYDLHVNYVKIQKACNYLTDPAVEFISTENDTEVPNNREITLPWTGAFQKAIESIVNRKATVMGKPSAAFYDYIKVKAS